MSDKNKTMGKVIHDHLVKNWNDTDASTIRDQIAERSKGYRDELIKCVEDNKDKVDGDLWIDVQKKEERLFKGKVHRLYFIAKRACPSPTNDQDVFKYNKKDDRIEYIWSVPDVDTCRQMMADPLGVPEDQKSLLNFVIDFKEGRLLERAKKLNGETKPSPVIMKG